MRIFLTGATGFIGVHIAGALTLEGHTVLSHGLSRNGPFKTLPDDVDAVVNSAGRLGGENTAPEELEEANYALPVKLYRSCRERGLPLIHLSTPGVCGLSSGGRETDEYAPEGDYEETKARAERYLLQHDDGVTILRPDFVFGGGDMHKYPLFRQVSRGWFPLVGSGKILTRPTDARDVASAVIASLPGGPLSGGVFNIAGGKVLSMADIVRTIASVMGRRVMLIHVPRMIFRVLLKLGPLRPGALSESRYRLFGTDRYSDTAKAEIAGFRPAHTFEETAREAIDWYRERGLL